MIKCRVRKCYGNQQKRYENPAQISAGRTGCRTHVQRSGRRWIFYPAIAHGEYAAVKNYAPVAEKFPEVESVKNDEKRHGDTVKGLLNKEQDGQFPEGMFRFEKRIER